MGSQAEKTMEIVDAHQHVGSLADALPWTDAFPDENLPIEADIARRVELMDQAGVDWAVLQPGHG